jgi:hypothetical protein
MWEVKVFTTGESEGVTADASDSTSAAAPLTEKTSQAIETRTHLSNDRGVIIIKLVSL